MNRHVLHRHVFAKKKFSLQKQQKITPFGATAERNTTWKM
jgi:hypothetical protein